MAYRSFLAFSCIHRPIHDEESVQWLIEQVRERQPSHLICLGDMFDAECLGRWVKSGQIDLQDEYDSAAELLAQLKDASPKSKRVWMMGNHEQRMFRSDWSALSSVLDYRKRIEGAKAWKHFDYEYDPRHTFQLGQVTFYHGFVTGVGSVKKESVKLGVPFGITISGHTHRPHPVHRLSFGTTQVPYWHLNSGAFIGEADYSATVDDSMWGTGIAIGEAETKRRYDGRQNWRAELLLHKMKWGDLHAA